MKRLRSLGVFLFYFLLPASAFPQGSLTPPGPPAPTMKTLDQVEARTIVNATNTPGDSTNLFIINKPGSYYLTGNITGVANTNGMSIQADNVTLDLNGFALIGPVGSGSGIIVPNTQSAIAIRNGTVRNWSNGILALSTNDSIISHIRAATNSSNYGIAIGMRGLVSDCAAQGNRIGISADNDSVITNCAVQGNTNQGIISISSGGVVSNCTARGNGGNGFNASYGTSFINCVASFNTAGSGFNAGPACTLTNCKAYNNTGSYGITAGTGSTLTNCSAYSNVVTSGILAGSACTLTNCNSYLNTGDGIQLAERCEVTGCTASSNGNGAAGSGITGGIRETIKNCSATENQKSGIVVLGDSFLLENHASHNGLGAQNSSQAAGIDSSSGGGSRIEGNAARDNIGTGILTNAADIVIRNSAGFNTTNYSPSSGTNFAPVQSPSAATNPLANLVH